MNGAAPEKPSLYSAPLLLIDGYNLLYATDITGQGRDAGTLQASRQALLDFLVDSLGDDLLERTVIVFDAKDPPPGLPRKLRQAGLHIHYATGFPDADELLGQYIEVHTAARQLLVVSSDHQVQRAARRRRATYVDSDVWYREILAQRHQTEDRDNSLASEKPTSLPSAAEVQLWLQQFSSDPEIHDSTTETQATRHQNTETGPTPDNPESTISPFPPGYAEDLLAEDHPGEDEEDGFSLD